MAGPVPKRTRFPPIRGLTGRKDGQANQLRDRLHRARFRAGRVGLAEEEAGSKGKPHGFESRPPLMKAHEKMREFIPKMKADPEGVAEVARKVRMEMAQDDVSAFISLVRSGFFTRGSMRAILEQPLDPVAKGFLEETYRYEMDYGIFHEIMDALTKATGEEGEEIDAMDVLHIFQEGVQSLNKAEESDLIKALTLLDLFFNQILEGKFSPGDPIYLSEELFGSVKIVEDRPFRPKVQGILGRLRHHLRLYLR